MRIARAGSPRAPQISPALKTGIDCRSYLLKASRTGDCHGIVSHQASAIALGFRRHISRRWSVVGEGSFCLARPRRRPRHREQLHAIGNGDPRLRDVGTGGRRRADRRHAPALALAARWLWVESAGLPLIRHPEARASKDDGNGLIVPLRSSVLIALAGTPEAA